MSARAAATLRPPGRRAARAVVRADVRAPTHWLAQVPLDAFPRGEARLPARADVVVVGGGVMGVAAAYWLARLGADVVLLEARRLCWGASGRNAGLVLGRQSGLESLADMRALLAEERVEAEYEEPGHLALASSHAVLERMHDEVARRPATASPLHVLDHAACEELLGMRIHASLLGGRWLPLAGAIHPARFVYALAGAAARRGVVVATGTLVTRLARPGRGDGVVVETAHGLLHARQVVLACGAKTGRLWRALRRALVAARGQVLSTRPTRRVFRVGLAVDWGTVYWRQAADGTIVLGGLSGHDASAEATSREALNPRIQSALSRFLPEAFPDLPPLTVSRRWAGIMDETPDGRPLVGRCDASSEVWVAAGFGGHGLPPALGVGRTLAHLVLGEAGAGELDAFDPRRFAGVCA
jgi:sarcosine oxidase subunit beta